EARRALEVAEAEARRALEVAEAEARDALEVAEAEARRALEVAEAEARRALEVAEAEARRALEVAEAEARREAANRFHGMKEIALVMAASASGSEVEEIPTLEDAVCTRECEEKATVLDPVLEVEHMRDGGSESVGRRRMAEVESRSVCDSRSAVGSISCIKSICDDEEEARGILLEAKESQWDHICSLFEEGRFCVKSRVGTTEEEERMLSASRSYSNEYKWRMLKMVKLPPDTQPPRPFIGFSLAEFLAESFVQVDGLYLNGPAYQVGIRIGDTLLSIEGEQVTSISEVRRAVSKHCRVADLADLVLRRPDGAVYCASLWVMTAELRFKGEPYFFDISRHKSIQRNRHTEEIEVTPKK
ncbi:kinetoplast DNA-associated protein, partial [Trypanosoma conorhini]